MGWKDSPLVEEQPRWASSPLVEEQPRQAQPAVQQKQRFQERYEPTRLQGLTGRALTEGVLGIVDILGTPVRVIQEQVTGKRVAPVAPTIADMLGFPRPETPTERVVQDISQAVTGAGTGIGLAGSARPVTAAGQAIRETLTAAPKFQALSSALSSMAGGLTRESGAAPETQAIASLVAPLALAPTAAATARAARVPKQQRQTLAAARQAGYKISPTEVNPSILQQGLKGVSGKVATEQALSIENQAVTNNLTKRALGIPQEQNLDLGTLSNIRANAGQAYENISRTGRLGFLTKGLSEYNKKLDAIAAPFRRTAKDFPNAPVSDVLKLVQSSKFDSADAASVIARIGQLRGEADKAFAANDKAYGMAARQIANAMEDAMESHLKSLRQPDLLREFRDARQAIAKTYTVEKALNASTGNVDAKVLASELKKKKPLTNELKQVAQFAQAFPKEVQMPEKFGGTPGVSFADVFVGSLGSAITGDPKVLATIAARPAIRELLTSGLYQRAFAAPGGPLASQRFAPREIVGAGLLGPIYAE